MERTRRKSEPPTNGRSIADWPADVTQLLEEHHVAVLSDDSEARRRFAAEMTEHCRAMDGTRAIRLGGAGMTTIDGLEMQLRIAAGGHDAPARGLEGIASIMRTRGSAIKRQVFLWEDADAMLEADVDRFGQAANVLMAIAAEREYLSDDRLVIQRVVFIGGPKLGAYAEYERGQFVRWRDDSGGVDLSGAYAAVPRPRVLVYRVGE